MKGKKEKGKQEWEEGERRREPYPQELQPAVLGFVVPTSNQLLVFTKSSNFHPWLA
jgi:hypothetical protein